MSWYRISQRKLLIIASIVIISFPLCIIGYILYINSYTTITQSTSQNIEVLEFSRLENHNNVCFANSLIQCLYQLEEFKTEILDRSKLSKQKFFRYNIYRWFKKLKRNKNKIYTLALEYKKMIDEINRRHPDADLRFNEFNCPLQLLEYIIQELINEDATNNSNLSFCIKDFTTDGNIRCSKFGNMFLSRVENSSTDKCYKYIHYLQFDKDMPDFQYLLEFRYNEVGKNINNMPTILIFQIPSHLKAKHKLIDTLRIAGRKYKLRSVIHEVSQVHFIARIFYNGIGYILNDDREIQEEKYDNNIAYDNLYLVFYSLVY